MIIPCLLAPDHYCGRMVCVCVCVGVWVWVWGCGCVCVCVCLCVYSSRNYCSKSGLQSRAGVRRTSQTIAMVLLPVLWCSYPLKNQLPRSLRIPKGRFLALLARTKFSVRSVRWVDRTQCCVVAPSAFCPKQASYLVQLRFLNGYMVITLAIIPSNRDMIWSYMIPENVAQLCPHLELDDADVEVLTRFFFLSLECVRTCLHIAGLVETKLARIGVWLKGCFEPTQPDAFARKDVLKHSWPEPTGLIANLF